MNRLLACLLALLVSASVAGAVVPKKRQPAGRLQIQPPLPGTLTADHVEGPAYRGNVIFKRPGRKGFTVHSDRAKVDPEERSITFRGSIVMTGGGGVLRCVGPQATLTLLADGGMKATAGKWLTK